MKLEEIAELQSMSLGCSDHRVQTQRMFLLAEFLIVCQSLSSPTFSFSDQNRALITKIIIYLGISDKFGNLGIR